MQAVFVGMFLLAGLFGVVFMCGNVPDWVAWPVVFIFIALVLFFIGG